MKRKVLAGLLTVVMAAGFVAVPGMQTEVKADDKSWLALQCDKGSSEMESGRRKYEEISGRCRL